MTPEQDRIFAEHLSGGRLAAAFSAARVDIAENPLSPYSHLGLANCFLQAGHPRGAVEEASVAMTLSDNEAGCVLLRARAHFANRAFRLAYEDAAAVITKSMAAGSSFGLQSARLLAAAALLELDRTKQAMELLVLTPGDTFIDAGRLITRTEVFSAAAARFTTAFPMHPLSAVGYPATELAESAA